jgi:ribonuclease III
MAEDEGAQKRAEALEAVQKIVGHRFNNLDLLRSSLTHASIAETRLASNERLEFLGDAVLGLVICEELYNRYPTYLEGEMTRVKSVVVSRETCAQVADRLNLVEHLSLGKGITEAASLPASLAACAYESITGAVYLDGGLEPARRFILAHMGEEIDRVVAGEHRLNYKSLLQQHAQRDLGAAPNYEVLDEKGPDHAKAFEIAVTIRGRRYPGAWGPSKKAAEQRAAMEALRVLGHLEEDTVQVDPDPPSSHDFRDEEPQRYMPDD